ncbi:hypothetical protein CL630_00575 [bacterium]|nr:hypothetical protein [bacterium]|tara:strand:- start:5193 stop:6350 length:1158 start_codon:yes stop_codon:yes gene_type:complete
MNTLLLKIVTLPDGSDVEVSETPLEWWTKPNKSGFVRTNMLAPDPKQPRRHINSERLKELHKSIASCGVRETITVTPLSHVPWATIDSEHNDAFFLIVSGHRRWNGACLGELSAVPIRVIIYESEKDHRIDASLLNANREELSALEQGFEFARLRELKWKINELSAHFGIALPQLYGRMNLTRLHPDIQKLLDPELPRKRRLSVNVGGTLGGVKTPTLEELKDAYEILSDTAGIELAEPSEEVGNIDDDVRRFSLQKLLLTVIQQRSLSSKRAIELIREHSLRLKSANRAAGRKTERYQPRRRKRAIHGLVDGITGSVVMDWSPREFDKIFELSPREEVEEFIATLQEGEGFLGGLVKILTKIRDAKKPTHSDVLRAMREREATD